MSIFLYQLYDFLGFNNYTIVYSDIWNLSKVYTGTLSYFSKFSRSLKLFQNKKLNEKNA